jgi:hypothetical protein
MMDVWQKTLEYGTMFIMNCWGCRKSNVHYSFLCFGCVLFVCRFIMLLFVVRLSWTIELVLVMERVRSCFWLVLEQRMWIMELKTTWCNRFGEGGWRLMIDYKQGSACLLKGEWRRWAQCSSWLLLKSKKSWW